MPNIKIYIKEDELCPYYSLRVKKGGVRLGHLDPSFEVSEADVARVKAVTDAFFAVQAELKEMYYPPRTPKP